MANKGDAVKRLEKLLKEPKYEAPAAKLPPRTRQIKKNLKDANQIFNTLRKRPAYLILFLAVIMLVSAHLLAPDLEHDSQSGIDRHHKRVETVHVGEEKCHKGHRCQRDALSNSTAHARNSTQHVHKRKYEDARQMKARLISQIMELKNMNNSATQDERAHLIKEIEYLKTEMDRRKREKERAEEAEEEEEEGEREEEEEESPPPPPAVPNATSATVVDSPSSNVTLRGSPSASPTNSSRSPSAPAPTPAPEAPVDAKAAQQAFSAALSSRVKLCSKKEGAVSASLAGFDITWPKHLQKNQMFVHQTSADETYENYLDFLPRNAKEALKGYNFGKCAIVGNSAALATATHGKDIDKHDIVVRLNNAPTQQYERQVGTKTTFRILNKKWTQLYSSKDSKVGKVRLALEPNVTLVVSRSPPDLLQKLCQQMEISQPAVKVLVQNNQFITYTAEVLAGYRDCIRRATQHEYGGGVIPTLGLISILIFWQACSELTVYGFGGATHEPHAKFHYFRSPGASEVVGADKGNALAMEMKLVMSMAHSNMLTYCLPSGCIRDSEMSDEGTAWWAHYLVQQSKSASDKKDQARGGAGMLGVDPNAPPPEPPSHDQETVDAMASLSSETSE